MVHLWAAHGVLMGSSAHTDHMKHNCNKAVAGVKLQAGQACQLQVLSKTNNGHNDDH